MTFVDSVDDLLGAINERGVIIYGAGYVAQKFIESLRQNGLQSCIHFCVTTSNENKMFCGYEVVMVDELTRLYQGEVICVAVHETIRDEVFKELETRLLFDYLWISPFLLKLKYGEPMEEKKDIEVKRILESTKDNYCIAIRYAAVEQYYNKNNCGYDIYVKAQSLHCGKTTAMKRLNAFLGVIKNWDEHGFDISHRPAINEDYQILDGLHRITLARYSGMESIPCDLYRSTKNTNNRDEFVDIPSSVVTSIGLSGKEKIELERIYELIYQ